MEKSWCLTDRISCSAVFLIAALACVWAVPAHADTYRPWPGDFLRMGVGARAMGMGNAYNAMEGDIFSSYYNPAGLASIHGKQLALSHRYMTMDRYFTHLALGGKIGPDASFAFSWIGAGTEEIQGRDLNGNRTGNLKDSRNSFGVSFSKNINRYVAIGITPKLSLWKLADDDARAFGADVGILVRPLECLNAAFVVRDINSRFTWESKRWGDVIGAADGQAMEKEDKFPLYYTFGAAWTGIGDRLVISGMVESVEDNPAGFDFGASYAVNRLFTVRGGVYNYTRTDGLDFGSVTGGFSLRVTGTIAFDYTFASDSVENDRLHLFSLLLSYEE